MDVERLTIERHRLYRIATAIAVANRDWLLVCVEKTEIGHIVWVILVWPKGLILLILNDLHTAPTGSVGWSCRSRIVSQRLRDSGAIHTSNIYFAVVECIATIILRGGPRVTITNNACEGDLAIRILDRLAITLAHGVANKSRLCSRQHRHISPSLSFRQVGKTYFVLAWHR